MRALCLLLLIAAMPVGAEEVEVELVVLADASGSISEAEIRFQREGYAAALTAPSVLAAISSTAYGAIAVTYVEWAANTAVVADWARIDGRRSAEAFASALLDKIERRLVAWHRQNEASQRLETIPGVGVITATALTASIPDPSVFKPGRQFAAWLGLVPRQNSSGGREPLGRVSEMGNGYLRRLLVVDATSVTRRAPTTDTRTGAWVRSLLERKPTRLVTVAVANKTTRTVWVLLSKGETYRAAPAI